jgi:hypothetical protein
MRDPACEWIGFDGGPVPLPADGDCGCAAGDPNCGCAGGGGADPGIIAEGFCQPRWIEPCAQLPADQCESMEGCGIVELPAPCPPCAPDLPDCPVCEPVAVCAPLDRICGELGPDACAADLRCELYEEELCLGVDCPEGVDCPPVDECHVEQWCAPAPNRCANVPEEQCVMMNSCVALWHPDGTFDTCWSPDMCDGLNHDQCESHPTCHNELFEGPVGCWIDESGREICEEFPAEEWCVSDFQDQPEPGPGVPPGAPR